MYRLLCIHLILFLSSSVVAQRSAPKTAVKSEIRKNRTQNQVFKSLSFGHLLTPNNRTLDSGEFSIGTLYLAAGLTDNITIATSPFVSSVFKMLNLNVRVAFEMKNQQRFGVDLSYFKTTENRIDQREASCVRDKDAQRFICKSAGRTIRSYLMEATSLKLTYSRLFGPVYRFSSSFGYFYYIDDRMPFSFRMDPANDDRFAMSLTTLHEFRMTDRLFSGVEIGGWGLNYQYPYVHLGASLNYQWPQFIVGAGLSSTFSPSFPSNRVRSFPGYDSRASFHPEVEIQYFF